MKKRLFVDMDGTLAEWRNIELKIECEEDRLLVFKKMQDLLLKKDYFLSLKPHQEVVDAIRDLTHIFDVYIISCVIETADKRPLYEKKEWLNKYLPEIDSKHMIFVPDGKDKTEYIPLGVCDTDILIDDYSKNLNEFKKAGGIGLKLLNGINAKNGTWKGSSISKDMNFLEIENNIISVSKGNKVKAESPKRSQPILELTRDLDIEDVEF